MNIASDSAIGFLQLKQSKRPEELADMLVEATADSRAGISAPEESRIEIRTGPDDSTRIIAEAPPLGSAKVAVRISFMPVGVEIPKVKFTSPGAVNFTLNASAGLS